MSEDPHRHDPLRVAIVGGGVAALETLLALRDLAGDRVAPVLIADADAFLYRPLLVGEPFGLGHPVRHPLAEICRAVGAERVRDHVVEVRAEEHRVVTAGHGELPYDELVVGGGARPYPAFADGLTFEREASPEDFDEALVDVGGGFAPHVAIVVPDGVSWTLPAYELALLTAAWAQRIGGAGEHRITLLTPEPAPLAAFGATASDAVDALLAEAGVVVRCGVHPDVVTATSLRAGGAWVGADRIVSLPLSAGPRLAGLPCDAHGFVRAAADGRVEGVEDVHVAGDAGTSPIKQGGLAAQQAAAVAAGIARRAGAEVPRAALPASSAPVLRGVLLTAHGPRFLRAELDDVEATSTFSEQPLWWPPTKIASRWLAPYLAERESARDGHHALERTDA
jgi:sulfide:quinone oxidoreductase